MNITIDSRRLADIELALAQARHFVKREADQAMTVEYRDFTNCLISRIDILLGGTIFDVTRLPPRATEVWPL